MGPVLSGLVAVGYALGTACLCVFAYLIDLACRERPAAVPASATPVSERTGTVDPEEIQAAVDVLAKLGYRKTAARRMIEQVLQRHPELTEAEEMFRMAMEEGVPK